MQKGKVYRLIESTKDQFIAKSNANEDMVKVLEENGHEFTVDAISETISGEKYVTRIHTKNGKTFTSDGSVYFEICKSEFRFFEEVTEFMKSVESLFDKNLSVVSVVFNVNKDNATETIEAIKKMFA